MHDIRAIRSDPAAFDAALARRGWLMPEGGQAAHTLAFDEDCRRMQTELQQLQARRNEASKAVGAAKAHNHEAEAARLMAEVAALKERMPKLEAHARDLEIARDLDLQHVPNLPAADVPDGPDESANVVVNERGEKPAFDFTAEEHDAVAARLGYDPDAAARIAGARFAVLKGGIARLHRALGQFMLDLQTEEHGYTEVAPPLLVRDAAMVGTGQLPKFAEDGFQTTDGRWLIPTAEVSLTNLARETIWSADALPMRFVALTPCFRQEAGAAGKDTRGLIRQHQFDKVELVSITPPEDSDAEHERMTACAEAVLERLGLAYRRMLLCTGDMGFSARKTYDLEVWLPGQGRWREISSCSNCGDFQARRMEARYRAEAEAKPEYVHTLNGSGLAVGRALVAVIENYQQADGSVIVPNALRPYMGGTEVLEPAG